MIDALVAMTTIGILVAGPVLWRAWLDRRQERALSLHAALTAAVRSKLGGESFLAVHVTPSSLWRSGRVLLSVPSGWEWLIASVWTTVVAMTPPDYELVVKPAGRRAAPVTPVPALRAA